MNLTEKAREMCKKLLEKGFNGLRFEKAYVEEQTHEPDEQTLEEFQARQNQYVAFIIEPRIPYSFPSEYVCEYEIPGRFDTGRYQRDIIVFIKQTLGPNVRIRHYEQIGEYEVEQI